MLLGYVNKVFLFVMLLTQEEVGLINLIFGLGLLFAQFANLGSINSMWKFFPYLYHPKKKHHGFLSLNLLIALVGVVIFSLIYLIFKENFSNYFESKSSLFVEYYYWVLPVGIFLVLFKLLENHLRGLYKNVFAVLANDLFFRLATTAILTLYAFSLFDFDTLLALMCLSQALPALLFVIPKKFQKIILVFSTYSYMNSLAAILVISIDSIMISGMIGLSDFGTYSIVLNIIGALMIPYGAIMRVSSAIVSQHWKDRSMDRMDELYKQVSSVTLFIGLFLFLGTWVSIEEIFSVLPKDYSSGITVFLLLMIGRIFDMYMGLNGTILVASKKYRYDVLFTGSLILIVTGLNLWFIHNGELMVRHFQLQLPTAFIIWSVYFSFGNGIKFTPLE
jgi:O-antigen/teichoic acid export membrane protein